MFDVDKETISFVLRDYNIQSGILNISELQRYHYEKDNPDTKEVRLIMKVELSNGTSVVIRFKNEEDVTPELIESQCQFAETLKANGIPTPHQYKTNRTYANWYHIHGYDVIVTVEEFVENEVKIVDELTAYKTGKLLAETHNISEKNNLHIDNEVLFNPFKSNDLFDYEGFLEIENGIGEMNKSLFLQIVEKYNEYMEILSTLKQSLYYAVQGDISDCNLYHASDSEIGVFDYNRAGDNILYCDAVMQAVFESKLMDYPADKDEAYGEKILTAFWKGYHSVRSFTEDERLYYPYLYCIIDAFWSSDIRWNEDSLLNAYSHHDENRIHYWLTVIMNRLSSVTTRKWTE